MYICICNAVTERQIEQAYHDGARTLRDLQRDLGVATCCGRCAPAARECLQSIQENHAGSTPAFHQTIELTRLPASVIQNVA